MNANVDFDVDFDATPVPDDHTVCQGPCGEVFHVDDTMDVAGFRLCNDCYREHPDVVHSLYEDLKADMLSDDY